MGGCFSSDKAFLLTFFTLSLSKCGQKKVRENPPFRKAKQNSPSNNQDLKTYLKLEKNLAISFRGRQKIKSAVC